MSVSVNGTNGVTFNDSSSQNTSAFTGGFGFRNRIINPAMVIDQRNAGASVTPTNAQYLVDRWQATLSAASKFTVQQNAGSVTPPVGFTNYLGATSSSAYSIGASDFFTIRQQIEGYNVADLGWGTANAKTVTLSFQVYSSLTGTFGGAISNGATNRAYPFSYSVSVANTWTTISITIAGDTTGTWSTTNGTGMIVQWGLGVGSTYSTTAGSWTAGLYLSSTGTTSVVGTNGATFYITGVQLEKGSTATSFDYRPYGTELMLCQRYFWKGYVAGGGVYGGAGGNIPIISWSYPVTMRATPTYAWVSGGTSTNGNNSFPITGLVASYPNADSLQILYSQTGASGANSDGTSVTGALSTLSIEL